ncbi:MAG: pyridoxamine 5'-phosphate oxidase family protein [Campylobacteraceae bacterium]|nr:pyridoxamine 5'-phosphate oxidase family protein [Campylobacteraceae bacterium]
MKTYTDEEILEEFKNFSTNKYSLVLSTVNEDHSPLTSYAPFVEENGNYYVCISSSLPHYSNMTTTKQAHVFIIEDENNADHIYARKRLYFNVSCELAANEENIFKLFDQRYGESLSFLRNMKDFKVLELSPKEKSLVLGFGAAYVLKEDGKLAQKTISHK